MSPWQEEQLVVYSSAPLRRSEPVVDRDFELLNPPPQPVRRSEEHTSELQSRQYLVCRLLLEKKNNFLSPDYSSSYPRSCFFLHPPRPSPFHFLTLPILPFSQYLFSHSLSSFPTLPLPHLPSF